MRRCGHSGSPAPPAKRSVPRLASSRRSIAGAWTFSPRAARSTSRARGSSSVSPLASGCARGLAAPSIGTVTITGSDKIQDQLFAPAISSRAKYAALVVGRPGIGALLKYELIVMFAQAWPGALGLALRKALYPMLLGSCGRNVVFGQHVVLRHPHKIHVGSNVVVDDNCLL